ncbi:MAG: hypothetical protein JHC33_13165 [Ignisphaera sp.]|jgi:hypothetical protein|nr:hypothetical protein [Ignisphaera sp.]
MNINNTYSFFTLSPTILGTQYTNMAVKAILNADEAIKYRDIVTLHEKMKVAVSGLPNSVKDCTFYLLENTSGDRIVLANEYIDQSTVTLVTSVTINISVFNSLTTDVAILRARLQELGYTNFSITTN